LLCFARCDMTQLSPLYHRSFIQLLSFTVTRLELYTHVCVYEFKVHRLFMCSNEEEYHSVPYYIHLISKCLCIVICVLDAMNGCSIDIVQSSLEHHTHMCYIAVSKYCYQWPITPTRTSLTSFFCSLTMQCTRGTRAAKARFINYLQHPPAVYTRFHPA